MCLLFTTAKVAEKRQSLYSSKFQTGLLSQVKILKNLNLIHVLKTPCALKLVNMIPSTHQTVHILCTYMSGSVCTGLVFGKQLFWLKLSQEAVDFKKFILKS